MVQASKSSISWGDSSQQMSKWEHLKQIEASTGARIERIASHVTGYHTPFPYIAASVFAVVFIIVGVEVYIGYLSSKKNATSKRLRELTKLREASVRADSLNRPAEAPAKLAIPWSGLSSPGLGPIPDKKSNKSKSPGSAGSAAAVAATRADSSSPSTRLFSNSESNSTPVKAAGAGVDAAGASNQNGMVTPSPASSVFSSATNTPDLKAVRSEEKKRGDSGYRMRKVDEFLKQITGIGLGCRRQKVAGTPPTPRNKCLKLRADGLLYFYSETFKVKRAFYSEETWDLRELTAAVEGDPYLGEVYLEFTHKHTRKHTMLRVCVEDTRERRNCIKQFEELISQMRTHPEWVLKICRDNSAVLEGDSGTSTATNGSPRLASPSPGKQAVPPRAVSVPDGLIDHSPRDPSSPNTARTILDGIDDDDSYDGSNTGQTKTYQVSYKTNFHEWINKELLSLITHEGLDHLIRVHRERQDLIRVLETHFRRKYNKPIVVVNHADFADQLQRIYRIYNKDKIPEIPKMVEHFKGKEHYLLETIIERYEVAEQHMPLFGAER